MSQQEQVFTIDERVREEILDSLEGTFAEGHYEDLTTQAQAFGLYGFEGWNLLEVYIMYATKPLCAEVLSELLQVGFPLWHSVIDLIYNRRSAGHLLQGDWEQLI